MTLLITLLYIVFILSAIVLVVVILLQEGKGGGLTSALGTSGQQTFGVGASGIIKFTTWTGVFFLGSALALHYFNRVESGRTVLEDFGEEPVVLPGDPNAGVQGGQAPPGVEIPPPGGQTPPPGGQGAPNDQAPPR